MKRASAAMAVAVLLLGGSASAATVPGVNVTADGLVSVRKAADTHYTAPPKHDPGAAIIYSNIAYKYPNGLYFCCAGALVTGPDSPIGQDWAAIQFTPTANAAVTEIDVPVQKIDGTALVDFGIYTDENGLPGKLLKKFKASGFGLTGTCCALMVGKDRKGIPIEGGTPYWIGLTTDKKGTDAFANWPTNSTDQIDIVPTAVNKGSGWETGFYPTMAFAVYGKTNKSAEERRHD